MKTLNNTNSELENYYRGRGYSDWFNSIDAEIVSEDKDQCCNNPQKRFIGLQKKEENSRIAICHCDNCGKEYEF